MIPALFDVGHCVYSGAGEDAHGNQVDSWAAPVSKKFVTYAAPRTTEPKLAGHDRDVVEVEMIVHPDFGVVSPRDRMVVDGDTFEVIGKTEDYTKNPFRPDFGCLIINLKQVSG